LKIVKELADLNCLGKEFHILRNMTEGNQSRLLDLFFLIFYEIVPLISERGSNIFLKESGSMELSNLYIKLHTFWLTISSNFNIPKCPKVGSL